MTVSVVVNGLNEEQMIGNCLLSLRNQTMRPDEVLYVDGGSTDRTVEYASFYADRIILGPKGIVRQTNAGINGAAGDVIAKADADTLYDDRWLERIIAPLADPRVAVASGPICALEPNAFNDVVFKTVNATFGEVFKLGFGANMAFRKADWATVGGMKEPDCASDLRLAADLRELGGQVYVGDALAFTDLPLNRQLQWISEAGAIGISGYYLLGKREFNPLVTGSLTYLALEFVTMLMDNPTNIHHSYLGIAGLVLAPLILKRRDLDHFSAGMHALVYHHFITEDILDKDKAIPTGLAWLAATGMNYALRTSGKRSK